MGFGALFLGLWLLLKKEVKQEVKKETGHIRAKGVGPTYIVLTAVCGLFIALDLYFWHRSIYLVGPGLATILANFQVFVMAALGFLFLGEGPGLKFFVAVTLAFLGLLMIIGFDISSLPPEYLRGVGLGLLAALTYGVYIFVLRLANSRTDHAGPRTAMLYVSIFSGLFLLGAALLEGASLVIPDLKNALALLAYGLVTQALGWVLISRSLPGVSASLAGLAMLLQPALAFFWDILFFGREADALALTGMLIAVSAIVIAAYPAQGGKKRLARIGPSE